MKKIILFTFAGLFLFGCSNSGNKKSTPEQGKQSNIEITNDMENASAVIPSWINEKTVVAMKNPVAHSGEFASVTNDTSEYAYAYQEVFKNINSAVPKHVVVDGWIYSTVPNPNVSIIMDLSENFQAYDWKPFPLKDKIAEAGKWVEFTADFYFDKPLKPEHQIKLYGWNQSKKPVYFDDLKITFEY